MQEVESKKSNGAEQQKASIEKKSLQQTIDEAKKDGVISRVELQDITERYEEEKGKITVKSELEKLKREVGEGVFINGMNFNEGDLDALNKLLVSLDQKPIPERKITPLLETDLSKENRLLVQELRKYGYEFSIESSDNGNEYLNYIHFIGGKHVWDSRGSSLMNEDKSDLGPSLKYHLEVAKKDDSSH